MSTDTLTTPTTAPAVKSAPVLPSSYLFAFILVTSLFALWGFANDITNPMVAAFKNILLISNFESSLVQFAFYGGYCVMAVPAALFIQRFSYRAGLLVGLGLYAIGCLLFVPAGNAMMFEAFLAAYFIMTCGLSFLETSANPYILSMGPAETATRRLNFAQAFNPLGSITGMLVARNLILAKLDTTPEEARRALAVSDPAAFAKIQAADFDVIVGPYVALGMVVLVMMVVFALVKLPAAAKSNDVSLRVGPTVRRLLARPHFVWGVVAQAFYVGAQIMLWTFIIQYAVNELGMAAADAQTYNIAAMVIFVSSRFICTYMLKYFSPGKLLAGLAVGGGALTAGTIFLHGLTGLYCLVGVSACMSLMFPTIYGIALEGTGEDAKLGSAGLILAIGGGCIMTPLQGAIMDLSAFNFGLFTLSSTRASFFLPLLCFVVIAIYGWFNRAPVVAVAQR
jgi:FHS family L-fucose permease-like MFS transporter